MLLFYLLPLFLGLAGLLFAWQGHQMLASRWTPATLAATHFVVLGTLAPVMCGALLQISPVLLGAAYPRVRLVACLTAAGLAGGSLMIGAGFLLNRPAVLLSGGVVVAIGLGVFLAASYWALARAAAGRETLWAVRLAVLALAVTIALGLTLALARFGWLALPQHPHWVETHVAWGLAGWIGLLLAGVGMEIIPLFYITPPFRTWAKRTLPVGVLGLLALVLVMAFGPFSAGAPWLLQGVLAALFLAHLLYNLAALAIERQRQRQRRDANLWLWQASHVAIIAAFPAWMASVPASLTGTLLLGGALSFVIGALMKIVPFMSWLDLQQRRTAGSGLHVRLPRLRSLLPDGDANAIALTFTAAIGALLAASLLPALAHLGGGLLVVCALLLARVLIRNARTRGAVIRELAQASDAAA